MQLSFTKRFKMKISLWLYFIKILLNDEMFKHTRSNSFLICFPQNVVFYPLRNILTVVSKKLSRTSKLGICRWYPWKCNHKCLIFKVLNDLSPKLFSLNNHRQHRPTICKPSLIKKPEFIPISSSNLWRSQHSNSNVIILSEPLSCAEEQEEGVIESTNN